MGIALLRVHEIRKLLRILDEEYRGVVPDEVPVAFLGVELDRETAWVALRIRAAALAAHRGEADEYAARIADFRE
jgi:hypothetical protein